jgi:uncharacterized protein YkwD
LTRAASLGLLAAVAAALAAAPAAPAAEPGNVVVAEGLEARIVARVNGVRRWHGLAPLGLSRGLTASARRHSLAMAGGGFFEHQSADGTPFWRRIERSYASRGFSRWEVGENILWSSPSASAVAIVRRWLRSPSHRANVLSGSWREVGVGALRVRRAGGAFGGRRVTIVTLDLGIRVR